MHSHFKSFLFQLLSRLQLNLLLYFLLPQSPLLSLSPLPTPPRVPPYHPRPRYTQLTIEHGPPYQHYHGPTPTSLSHAKRIALEQQQQLDLEHPRFQHGDHHTHKPPWLLGPQPAASQHPRRLELAERSFECESEASCPPSPCFSRDVHSGDYWDR
jgi:hypothetical protein